MIPGQRQESYQTADSLTASQSALTTDKSQSTVNALASGKKSIIQVPNGNIAVDIRFRSTASDGDSKVLNLYAMRGDSDHYTLIATFTLTTGTQVYTTGNRFVDTISKDVEKWTDTIVVGNDAANGIARIILNTHGYRNFCFIATTLGSTSVIPEFAWE